MSDMRAVFPIDRDALQDAVFGYLAEMGVDEWGLVQPIRRMIQDAPTLDYAPVRRGEWLECACDDPYRHTCNMRYRCSECGRFALNQEPYCHCGARMDGGMNDV